MAEKTQTPDDIVGTDPVLAKDPPVDDDNMQAENEGIEDLSKEEKDEVDRVIKEIEEKEAHPVSEDGKHQGRNVELDPPVVVKNDPDPKVTRRRVKKAIQKRQRDDRPKRCPKCNFVTRYADHAATDPKQPGILLCPTHFVRLITSDIV